MAVDTGLLNAIITGVVTGSIVALGAIGLALVYDIAEVPNFAHGDLLTFGAYAALFVNKPGTVPLFDVFATGQRAVGVVGIGFLFVVSLLSVLGIIYHLGGMDALKGSWWGIEVSPPVALGAHGILALAVAGLIVVGMPSFPAALLFAVVVAGAVVPLMESYVFRKFRERDAELAMMLIVSLALAFIVRFGIQTIFGGEIRFYQVDSSLVLGGLSLNIVNAVFYDIYLAGRGLMIHVQLTGGSGVQHLTVLGYNWLEVLGILIAVAATAYWAYNRRKATAGVIGPRLAAAAGGLAVFLVGGALLSGGGAVPETAVYSTRVSASPLRLGVIVIALVMMGLLHYLLKATTLGKAMRATSDNRDLAMVRGIDTRLVMMSVWIIAGLFAAVAGVLLAFLFSNLSINLGFNLLLPMFAGVILGGISVYGAILGSYVVGLAMEVGIFAIPGLSSTYRVSVAFIVLFVVLLVKPEGIVGGS